MSPKTFCDGFTRRGFLRFGAISGFGFSFGLPQYLSHAAAGGVTPSGKTKSAIFVRLGGGASHLDTFDLKPDAPQEYRGEFRPIGTKVAGMQICEHLPKLAQCADRFALVRGVSHTLAAHELAIPYMGTGNRPLPSIVFPSYGAVVSKEFPQIPELPSFVAVPRQGTAPTGFLGAEFGPFETGFTPKPGKAMEIHGLALNGVTLADIDRRQNLVKRFDTAFGSYAQHDRVLSGMDEFGQKAYSMIRSNRARDAFDLTKEPESITKLFAEDSFSQSCLLATRLVEAGVKFVTLNHVSFDTHYDNFNQMKNTLLPPLDAGLSALFEALTAKGLFDSTVVYVTGEFGRTPKINGRAGRDHHPRANCCLLAGGGIRGGQVVGASDARGEEPLDRVISPDDVAATFYTALGINPKKEYRTTSGRPVMIVRHGTPIPELI